MVIGGTFPRFEESQTQMMNNIEKFAKTFVEIGLTKIKEDEREKFTDPGVNMTITDAVKIASRKNNEELHKILADLIVQRVQYDDELKQVVFNEAIVIMDKLTSNQLKIITLLFVMNRISWHKIQNMSQLNIFAEKVFSKLIPFRDTKAELGHLGSTSWTETSLGS